MKKLFCILAVMLIAVFAFAANPRNVNKLDGSVSPIAAATIFTVKAHEISAVVLAPIYHLARPSFGGSLDYDAFAGFQGKTSPVGGCGLVYTRALNERISGAIGFVATLQNRTPVDYGLLIGISLRL